MEVLQSSRDLDGDRESPRVGDEDAALVGRHPPNLRLQCLPSDKFHDEERVRWTVLDERAPVLVLAVCEDAKQVVVYHSAATLPFALEPTGDVVEGCFFDVLGIRRQELHGAGRLALDCSSPTNDSGCAVTQGARELELLGPDTESLPGPTCELLSGKSMRHGPALSPRSVRDEPFYRSSPAVVQRDSIRLPCRRGTSAWPHRIRSCARTAGIGRPGHCWRPAH
jgi:hypothetical protein